MNADSDNRFVSINRRLLLRGWQGMPYALLDDITGHAVVLPEYVFRKLQLCSGQYREEDPIFFGGRREILRKLAEERVIVYSDAPSNMPPKQSYRSYPNRFIRKVMWALTGRCNYRCRHCYMSAPRAVLPHPGTRKMLKIVDEIAGCGIPVVTLTGGEPLIRDDFLEIVERLVSKGVRISTIMTNGALVTDALLESLEKLGVICGFDISFDGVDGWHDWMRGVKGAGENAIRALRLCHEHGFETGVQLALHKGNLPVLRESIRLLAELGVTRAIIGGIDDEGEAHSIGKELILNRDEMFDAMAAYLPQFIEDGMPLENLQFSAIFDYRDGTFSIPLVRHDLNNIAEAPLCRTHRSSLYISPDGYVLPCIPLSYNDTSKTIFPNVSEVPLSEILSSSAYTAYVCSTVKDVYAQNPECRSCAYSKLCGGGCRGKAAAESRGENLMGRAAETCSFFLGGYYERAKEILGRLQKDIDAAKAK